MHMTIVTSTHICAHHHTTGHHAAGHHVTASHIVATLVVGVFVIVVFVSDEVFHFGLLGCIGRVDTISIRSIGRGGSYVKVIRLLWFAGINGVHVK